MGIHVIGTSIRTGRKVELLDRIATRNGLGVKLESGFSGSEPLVKLAGDGYRANLGAFAACGAFSQIDISGALTNSYLEIAFFSRDTFQISIGDQIYVKMPADLDQLGRDNSHGAFIGRECLIKLGHASADSRLFFQKMNIIA